MRSRHELAIAGSGFAGLGMAIELKRSGIDDFVVLERAESLGGTWRDNHYPGCACDVPTPLYSYSFAPNPHWSYLYARSDEIRRYLEDCADRFDVRRHIRFGADVSGARWDEQRRHWEIEVGGEPELTARIVVGGFGGLSEPAFPAIPGLDDFGGALFHSADWDDNVSLDGARVGVIGTGASAIQIVPRAARDASRVTVFQRTPPWVLPQFDRKIGRAEQWLYARAPFTQRMVRATIFAITEAVGVAITRYPGLLRGLEWASRAYMRRAIGDRQLRRALRPSYRLGCKRILVANDYYPALAKPNVELVTDAIAGVTKSGLIDAAGVEHPLDVLVCATGFDIEQVFNRLEVRGRGGVDLRDVWAGGIEAHRGTTIASFPNMVLLSGPNTGTGSTSQVFMIEAQIRHVLELLRAMRRTGAASFEPRAESQAAYNAWLQSRMPRTVWLRGGCDSWYLDSAGVNRTLYPGASSSFRRSLRRVRLDEYVFEPDRVPAPKPAVVAVS